MADKKLNTVSTASDGAYVYAEDANGGQVKISKADLASVVAEQIGFNASRLVNAATLNSGANIDSLKSSCGCFRYWGDSAVPGGTYPITMSTSVSFLLYTFTTTNGMCWQVMFTGNVHAGSLTHKYERVYAGRWSAWNDAGAINY